MARTTRAGPPSGVDPAGAAQPGEPGGGAATSAAESGRGPALPLHPSEGAAGGPRHGDVRMGLPVETIGSAPEDLPADLPAETRPLWAALLDVRDPELPVSLVDLGLIYDIRREGGTAIVVMTFTAMGCPCMEFMQMDVRDRLLREDGVDAVDIEVVWDPPWSREMISPKARAILKKYGVAA